MEIIDNVNKTLKEDLTTEIHKGSKVSIAAACFSIYAFAELKKELKNVDELRFIFTSPTFIKEKAKREKREFYIPRQEREKNLFGSEFEVKLRNEMTQKAIAKECAEWIRKKAVFKSNVTNENMMGFINVDDKNYMPYGKLPEKKEKRIQLDTVADENIMTPPIPLEWLWKVSTLDELSKI